MKKLSLFYAVSLCVLLLTSGCKKFLGIHPKGMIIPERAKEYEYLLNQPEMVKEGETFPELLTDNVLFVDDNEEYFAVFEQQEYHTKQLYSFAHGAVFDDADKDYFWTSAYSRISYSNHIIDDVPNLSDGGSALARCIVAEARVVRACQYLSLVNVYAPQYNASTAASDLAVPLVDRILPLETDGVPRATVQEIYDFIESELLAALVDLPDKPRGNVMRPCKAAAHGYLARMYLIKGEYGKALEYSRKALEYNDKLLDYGDYNDPAKYRMGIGFNGLPQKADNPEAILVHVPPYAFGLMCKVFLSPDLLAIIDKDADHRFRLNVLDGLYQPQPDPADPDNPAKYTSVLVHPYPAPLWVCGEERNAGLSVPEMLLTAAECEARVGALPQAQQLMEKLQANRYKGGSAYSGPAKYNATTKEEALRQVLEERRREFAFYGIFRFIDLRRLNLDPSTAKTVKHTCQGGEVELPPNDPRWVIPIPAYVMRMNSKVVQTDR